MEKMEGGRAAGRGEFFSSNPAGRGVKLEGLLRVGGIPLAIILRSEAPIYYFISVFMKKAILY